MEEEKKKPQAPKEVKSTLKHAGGRLTQHADVRTFVPQAMDDKTALDLLSSDFIVAPPPPAASAGAATKEQAATLESQPQKVAENPSHTPNPRPGLRRC